MVRWRCEAICIIMREAIHDHNISLIWDASVMNFDRSLIHDEDICDEDYLSITPSYKKFLSIFQLDLSSECLHFPTSSPA